MYVTGDKYMFLTYNVHVIGIKEVISDLVIRY